MRDAEDEASDGKTLKYQKKLDQQDLTEEKTAKYQQKLRHQELKRKERYGGQDDVMDIDTETVNIKQLRNASVDIGEFYSPPRATKTAAEFGLQATEALDLTTGWDFWEMEHRRLAID